MQEKTMKSRKQKSMGHWKEKQVGKCTSANVKHLIEKAAAIVHLFRKSPLAARELQQHQTKPYIKLRAANTTRWGSTLDMLQRIYRCRAAVTACLQAIHEIPGRDKPPPNLTEEEWAQVGAIIELLKPFQVATEFFSTQQSPTICVIFPVLHNLQLQLQPTPHDRDVVKALKPVLLAHLNDIKRHWAALDNILHLASFLDPRTKVFLFQLQYIKTQKKKKKKKKKKEFAWLGSMERVDALQKAHTLAEISLSQQTQPPSPKVVPHALPVVNRMADDIELLFGKPAMAQTQPTKPVVEEPVQYSSLPPLEGLAKHNSLLWWKQHQGHFPGLAALARRHLAIMASSAPVERVFSTSGWIVSKRRCAMTDATVSLLTFLAVNKHHQNIAK